MKALKLLYLYSQIIGITSTVFMVIVFISEAFYHHGMYFYEPNRTIATVEFYMSVTGLYLLCAFFIVVLSAIMKERK